MVFVICIFTSHSIHNIFIFSTINLIGFSPSVQTTFQTMIIFLHIRCKLLSRAFENKEEIGLTFDNKENLKDRNMKLLCLKPSKPYVYTPFKVSS